MISVVTVAVVASRGRGPLTSSHPRAERPDHDAMVGLSPLRCLTFEITGTLICMSVPLGKVYGDALRHYRLPGVPGDNDMKAAFKRAYVSTLREHPNYGAASGLSERAWWDGMIRATLDEAGCDAALEEETFPLVFQRIYSSFGSSEVWAACPDGIKAMRHAKEKGLVVGACSNVYHRYVDSNMPLLGLHRDLDFAATSFSLGIQKPDPAIFLHAAKQATVAHRLIHGVAGEATTDILPSQMLHVGDSLNNDFLAAKAVGMRALLFDPDGEHSADPRVSPDEIIRSLGELPSRIDDIMSASA